MKAKLFFLGIINVFFIQITQAQFPTEMPYQTIVSAIPVMPDYLDTVEDADVPDAMTIKRITEPYNYVDGNGDPQVWYPTHDYAKIQPWNIDGSLYKIRALALYDSTTHQEYRDLPGGQIYPVYWSNINSDLMYSFREDGAIKTYTVSTEDVQTIYTLVGYDMVKLGPGEGNIDKNDHYVALVGKKGVDLDVIVFDLQTNEIVHTEIFAGAWGDNAEYPNYVDWVSVSQSGDYVGIMWNHNTTSVDNPFNTHFGVEMYNTTDMQYLRRIAIYGNHGDFGYAANGDEVFVQFWGPTGTMNMFYLDRMEHIVLSTHADFDSSGHVSCRNLNRPGYAYISQDYQDHSGQIVAMKLDDSGLVEHFGHHYNSYSNHASIPVPNPNGDTIMFTSDFNVAQNNDEIYVFETKKSNVANVTETTNLDFIIYPNPVKDILYIDGKENITAISIYNTMGQLVKTLSADNTYLQINLESFNKGFYLIKLTDVEGNVFNNKILLR